MSVTKGAAVALLVAALGLGAAQQVRAVAVGLAALAAAAWLPSRGRQADRARKTRAVVVRTASAGSPPNGWSTACPTDYPAGGGRRRRAGGRCGCAREATSTRGAPDD